MDPIRSADFFRKSEPGPFLRKVFSKMNRKVGREGRLNDGTREAVGAGIVFVVCTNTAEAFPLPASRYAAVVQLGKQHVKLVIFLDHGQPIAIENDVVDRAHAAIQHHDVRQSLISIQQQL